MQPVFFTGCLVALAALTACAGLTDRPTVPSAIDLGGAEGAFRGSDASAFSSGAVPADWWRLYQDPVLDALVQDAIAANTDLRVAAANLAKSRAALSLADTARDPATSLGLGAGFERLSAEEELKGTDPLPSIWVYGLTAAVSYQIDLFGQIARTIEAADADVAATQAAYDAVRVTVIAETTRAYLAACSMAREQAVARRLVELQARRVSLTQRLVSGGRAVDLDITRLSAQEDQIRASLPPLVARKQVALYSLAALTGRSPTGLPPEVESCHQEPRLSSALPIGDGSALLRRRPDVRQAEKALRAAHARVGVAMGDLYPKIMLGASVGSAGLIRDAFDAGTNKFSLGPLITWQFPNRSSAKARISAQEAEERAAAARFDAVMLTALRETESALVVYARDIESRVALDAANRKAQRAASDVERLFVAGRQGITAVLDAARTSTETEQAVAAAETRLAADQVALFLALGGGWNGSDLR